MEDYSDVERNCDIESICEEPYFKDYQMLRSHVDGTLVSGDLRDVAECIRRYLEYNLRIRFPVELQATNTLGTMIGAIRGCSTASPLTILKPIEEELSEVNDYAVSPHHGEIDSRPLTDLELKYYADRAIRIGYGLTSLHPDQATG